MTFKQQHETWNGNKTATVTREITITIVNTDSHMALSSIEERKAFTIQISFIYTPPSNLLPPPLKEDLLNLLVTF